MKVPTVTRLATTADGATKQKDDKEGHLAKECAQAIRRRTVVL